MATIKFWSEMTKATSVDGQDKVMIGKNSNGEAMYVDFQYLVNQAGAQTSDYIPIDGNTLPTLGTENKFSIVGSGTYNQAVGGDVVVPENSLGIIVWDGDEWVLGSVVTIPAPVGVDTIDPEGENLPKEKAVAKYTFGKKEYVYHNLVPSFNPSLVRYAGVDITDEVEKIEWIKKFDQILTGIKVFGLGENQFLGIERFNYRPATNDFNLNFYFYRDGETLISSGTQGWIRNEQIPSDGIFNTLLKIDSEPVALEVSIDLSVFSDTADRLDIQSTSDSYKDNGIKNTSLKLIPEKSVWGTGLGLRTLGGATVNPYEPTNLIIHEAVKSASIKSSREELISLLSVNYFSGGDGILFLFASCLDDDPNNMLVTDDRDGFSYLRLLIKRNELGVGVRKFESFIFSGDSKSTISLVVDTDYLDDNIDNISNMNATTSYRGAKRDLARWVVSPSSGGGGGDFFFNKLTLVDSESDFEPETMSYNNSGNNFAYNPQARMTKLVRIPDGTNEIEFNLSFSGEQYNGDWLNKDFDRISKINTGGSTNKIIATPPEGAVFFRVATETEPQDVEIIAHGNFDLTPSIKDYRTLTEGLADKFSGEVFSVGLDFFKKDFDGICTTQEYSKLGGSDLSMISELEKDGSLIQAENVSFSNGSGTFNGGSLCAVKNGVMYFYNGKENAVFKSADKGQTFEVITDRFSHPDIWTDVTGRAESGNVIIPLDNGEILFPVRYLSDEKVEDSNSNQRYWIVCKTTNNQTDVEVCFRLSHEEALFNGSPTRSGGRLLSEYSWDAFEDVIVVTEYGQGASKYWREQGVSNNGNGVSARAWVSLDYGETWKKFFDGNRKKSGTSEDDNNWYWFTSKRGAMYRHIHGVFIDKVNRQIKITNGDNENYIWTIKIDDLKSWYTNAEAVSPTDDPEPLPTDTYPVTTADLISTLEERNVRAWSFMRFQMMSGIELENGVTLWGHDASREFAFVSRNEGSQDFTFEPVFSFEREEDYSDQHAYINSWGGTDGFVQNIKEIDGVIYFIHSHSEAPSRIWATKNGYDWKIVLEADSGEFGFGSKLIKMGDDILLTTRTGGWDAEDSGYWKLKEV